MALLIFFGILTLAFDIVSYNTVAASISAWVMGSKMVAFA
jgi:hypothetical protein